MNDNSRAGKVDRWKRPARASSYPLMNTRIGNSTLRGGQTVFHGIRMWGQLLRAGMFLAAISVVAVPAWHAWRHTTGYEWYAAAIVTVVEMKLAIGYKKDSARRSACTTGEPPC